MVGNIGHKDVPRIQLVVGRSAHLIKIFRLNIFKSECSEKQAGECYGTWRQPIPNMLHSGKKKKNKKKRRAHWLYFPNICFLNKFFWCTFVWLKHFDHVKVEQRNQSDLPECYVTNGPVCCQSLGSQICPFSHANFTAPTDCNRVRKGFIKTRRS